MKSLLFLFLLAAGLQPWQDPGVFEENRLPMSATFVTDQQMTVDLNGIWKFHFNPTIEGRLQGFEAPSFDDSRWDDVQVPGLWELQGYLDPVYVNAGYPWHVFDPVNPPYPGITRNHVGQYRRTFTLDPSWNGKQVCLNIGSATSNVRVWVNGKMVGYSEDSKLEARFDLTPYVKTGENVIALEIFRWCDGSYLEDQDFWRLSGIARGIEVYSREKDRIEDVHVTGSMHGDLAVDATFTSGIREAAFTVVAPDGKTVGTFRAKPVKGKVHLDEKIASPALWSAESPALYTLKVAAYGKKGLRESTSIDFGFRTVAIENVQLKVNGEPVLIKGADRHEMDPYKGYVVSEADMIRDIRIMKELNINAVRTCHYPDDPRWLALCDRYGLYVVDEGNIESHGMGYKDGVTLAQDPQFHDAHLARDSRMVRRDFNHPCVIVWSLGNEAGNGPNFIDCYDWIKAYDPSRPVQYERALHHRSFEVDRNTDIFCPMYDSPKRNVEYLENDPPRPLIQCEYAHAMGNSIGGLKEYWDLVRKYPSYQGGFIWDFVDQALVKPTDAEGTDHIFAFGGDYNDYDASDGAFNCNGIIASDRSLHPHAYEVRYQYRDILSSAGSAPGKVLIHNEFFFTDLKGYRLVWDLEADGVKVRTGVVEHLSVAPQQTAEVDLGIGPLPEGGTLTLNLHYLLKEADGLLPAAHERAYDQIVLRREAPQMAAPAALAPPVRDGDTFSGTFSYPGTLGARVSAWKAVFRDGALAGYSVNGAEYLAEPVLPCTDRALTENDLGARFQQVCALWRGIDLVPEKVDIQELSDHYLVHTEYKPIGDAAIICVDWAVYGDGTIQVCESLKDAGHLADAAPLLRFGVAFALPGRYSGLDFFGLGPWENYADRSSAALLGRYRQSVSDQYHYGYVRSQESGTHTGLSRFCILDGNGDGLEVTSEVFFSASALPFSLATLDGHVHSLELKKEAHENDRSRGTTFVHVDQVQMGLGSINSWGAWPLEPYLVPAGERTFRFALRPVNN